MEFKLEKLPYSLDALSPHISRETLEYHYGKHHQTYVNNLNNLIVGSNYMTIEEIILSSKGPIFNNAAQAWNHSFYWRSLSPNGGSEPKGNIATQINKNFGSFAAFKDEFTKAATSLFGSGWCWLVKKQDGNLKVLQTSNADTPIVSGDKPIIVCDVWEHAYYIDYRNARAKYVDAFWNLVNWQFAESNL